MRVVARRCGVATDPRPAVLPRGRAKPPYTPGEVDAFFALAAAAVLALGVVWPADASYADVVRGLRPTTRAGATFLLQALHALRGAGYAVVAPGAPVPVHAAVGAPYAHVTAPLRRLADRLEAASVQAAVDQGWNWVQIAEALGVTKQAVHKKYARRIQRRT